MKHRSDARVLNRRTLERDNRALASLLRPGLRVLDVGCGAGAITAGIARAVGPAGLAVGVDFDSRLLASAPPETRPVRADAAALPFEAAFDLVASARTLQWISAPLAAVASMAAAARPGALVVVLDYNHAANRWSPQPPPAFERFYGAFLDWRASNGWDNRIADRLPSLFASAGLEDIRAEPADERAARGDPDSLESVAIWSRVVESVGPPSLPPASSTRPRWTKPPPSGANGPGAPSKPKRSPCAPSSAAAPARRSRALRPPAIPAKLNSTRGNALPAGQRPERNCASRSYTEVGKEPARAYAETG